MDASSIRELERIIRLTRAGLVTSSPDELSQVSTILTNGMHAVVVELFCRERDEGIIRLRAEETVPIS